MKEITIHESRALASRNTSAAGRAALPPASHDASRRSASSPQSCAFSSSERLSRLASSRSAKRARACGPSFRTSASNSSMLIIGFYAQIGRHIALRACAHLEHARHRSAAGDTRPRPLLDAFRRLRDRRGFAVLCPPNVRLQPRRIRSVSAADGCTPLLGCPPVRSASFSPRLRCLAKNASMRQRSTP